MLIILGGLSERAYNSNQGGAKCEVILFWIQNGFSFYDASIVASAFSVKCLQLVTEDLQNQQIIKYQSHQLIVINPFDAN